MKLTYAQLGTHLSKQLAPIYMVCGDEPFLKQEALLQIRKAAKNAGATERAQFAPETAGDWEQLYPCLYATSLFAEKRLVELDLRHAMPNKTASLVLQEYATKPLADNILLIAANKIDEKTAKNTWYQALEKSGTVVPIWPLPREQLPQWITQRLRKYQLQIVPEAAVLLADSVEGNLAAAAQAIEKMYLLKPEGPIDTVFLADVLNDEGRYTIFDFVDSLIAGDKRRAIHLLEELKAEGTAPAIILWGATREFRLLAEMAEGLRQGLAHEQLFQKNRIFPRRQAAVRRFLETHSVEDCTRYLKAAAKLDEMIKGAIVSNVWEGLQWFCLRG